MSAALYDVEYRDGQTLLRAFEPNPDEVRAAAAQLSSYYNDEHNRAMLTHEDDMSVEEVVAHYTESRERGDRLFLIEQDGVLVGDADFRHFDSESAEYAIMIGARNLQGRGLGRKFTTMLRVGFARDGPCACVRDHPAGEPRIHTAVRAARVWARPEPSGAQPD